MKAVLTLAASIVLAANGAALAKPTPPFSISVVGSCDHLTINVNQGLYIGTSDAPSCDDSVVVGLGKGGRFYAAGDLGSGSTYAWTWSIVLGKNGNGTAILNGTDGSVVFGPYSFPVTYTAGGAAQMPSRTGALPPATSVFYRK